MDKRYQVFVSSTYDDLRKERQEVMHALLELDCMPSGMELFPAANEDQWSLIKKVIDECDYYLVISAGRYGSIGPKGISYTEMEYRYALEIGKPVIAFLHKDPQLIPAANSEQSDDGRKKLKELRALMEQKMCKYWESPAELGSVVSRSLVRLIKSTPAIGWIRTDQATDAVAAGEILNLRKTIEGLEAKLQEARLSAPTGTEQLSQGEEPFTVHFKYSSSDKKGETWTWTDEFEVSWNVIFYDIGPTMLDETTDQGLRAALNQVTRVRSQAKRAKTTELKGHVSFRGFEITDHDFQTIKVQLRALGLVSKSQKPRSIKDTRTFWTLTPYGDQVLTALRAIRKDAKVPSAPEEDLGIDADDL